MKPLGTRVLIKPIPPEETTASGLVIPASAQAQQSIGVVVEVGPDVKVLKKKNKVVYGKYAGTAVELDDQEYLVVKEEEVLLVI